MRAGRIAKPLLQAGKLKNFSDIATWPGPSMLSPPGCLAGSRARPGRDRPLQELAIPLFKLRLDDLRALDRGGRSGLEGLIQQLGEGAVADGAPDRGDMISCGAEGPDDGKLPVAAVGAVHDWSASSVARSVLFRIDRR
jgi:hypothetical protein